MSDLAGALETKSFGALHVKNAEQGEVTAIVATERAAGRRAETRQGSGWAQYGHKWSVRR